MEYPSTLWFGSPVWPWLLCSGTNARDTTIERRLLPIQSVGSRAGSAHQKMGKIYILTDFGVRTCFLYWREIMKAIIHSSTEEPPHRLWGWVSSLVYSYSNSSFRRELSSRWRKQRCWVPLQTQHAIARCWSQPSSYVLAWWLASGQDVPWELGQVWVILHV